MTSDHIFSFHGHPWAYLSHKIFFYYHILYITIFYSPFFSVCFYFLKDSTRECRAKVRRRTRNIPAQLCFAPDDSQQFKRALGVDASFFLSFLAPQHNGNLQLHQKCQDVKSPRLKMSTPYLPINRTIFFFLFLFFFSL